MKPTKLIFIIIPSLLQISKAQGPPQNNLLPSGKVMAMTVVTNSIYGTVTVRLPTATYTFPSAGTSTGVLSSVPATSTMLTPSAASNGAVVGGASDLQALGKRNLIVWALGMGAGAGTWELWS
ncbi:hypothetical protein JHW43_003354 [Diplocarpon mali]|nr:hypothetical protein JHW43_003354 [Diplocarpon mali]